MILTITPNAAVDKTYLVHDFRLHCVNRPTRVSTVAGGKGVNVARVFCRLGGAAAATGFIGGLNGRTIARALPQDGAEDEFVRVRGESRLCIAIVDSGLGAQTEVNEPGPEVTRRDLSRLRKRVSQLLKQRRFDFVVMSGRLPPGAPDSTYAELVHLANQEGARAVLDTSGEALREGIGGRPWMVKPNLAELEALTGCPQEDEAAAVEAAKQIHRSGVAVVCHTRGPQGAILVCDKRAWHAASPPVRVVSAVASGDAFVAAFLWAWTQGPEPESFEAALRTAVAAGAANSAVIGAGFIDRAMIDPLLPYVTLRNLRRSR
ncbi:MAG TPA: 1-phosphofructokinase family hexose kinase [Chthonomonadales bacterium]|nr:1-phosphofructokinase family hexose kinase [Chthonomonadales bacterium]